jgi:hypothetical protein
MYCVETRYTNTSWVQPAEPVSIQAAQTIAQGLDNQVNADETRIVSTSAVQGQVDVTV